jgi:hypothetical protein
MSVMIRPNLPSAIVKTQHTDRRERCELGVNGVKPSDTHIDGSM